MRTILMLVLVLVATPAAAQYTAPIGIPPTPSGLTPDRATPTAASQCANWPSAVSTNCYYIDNTHGSATDTSNPNGYPNQPRLTLPGSVSYRRIEIVGGGTAYTLTARTWTATGGSESNPSVITNGGGTCTNPTAARTFPSSNEAAWTNCPVLSASVTAGVLLSVPGDWVIVQGLNMFGAQFYAGGQNLDNAIFRRIHSYGIRDNNSVAYAVAHAVDSANYNNNLVIYQTEVSDWCDMASIAEEDCAGTLASRGSSNWWVVDNLWYDINGDSIRTGTNPDGGVHLYGDANPFACTLHDTNRAFNMYVGRNTFEQNGENAIDIKDSINAIFSQNRLIGPFDLGGSGTGGGGALSSHNHARDSWVIFNYIETVPIGIAISTDIAGTENGYYIGNVIVDTQAAGTFTVSAGQNDGAAVHIRTASGPCIFQHNTIYSVQRGINIETAQPDCQLMDNIVSSITTTHDAFGWEDSSALTGTDRFSHNLVHYGGSGGRFGNVGSTFYGTLATFNTGSALDCTTCLEGDPLFVNAAARNFALQNTSPARNAGSGVTTYYDLFATQHSGQSIAVDFAGNARPSGGAWDLGAYEHTGPVGTMITVCASGCTYNNSQLQTAINAAAHGDEIVLEAGMTYSQSGSFVLPQKAGSCSGDSCYTTIRSGVTSTGTLIAESSYPADGVRITPAYASVLAKIGVVVNNDAAIRTARTNACTSPCLANYWKLRRLEIIPNLYGGLNMIEIGSYRDDAGDEPNHQNTKAKIPSYHILDQLYIRGDEVTGQHRCVSVSSREFTLSNSYLRWCKTLQNDGQAVMICNTTGPGLIINNYIEASTEGTITCGLDPIARQSVTVSASPSPTTTVFAVSGVTDLALEQWICVTISGSCKQVQVTNIAGMTLTVSPALPSAPSVGVDVKWSVQVEGWTWRYNYYTRPLSMRDPIVATPTGVAVTPFLSGGNLAAGTYYIRVTGLHVGNFYSMVQSTRSAEVTCTISSGTTGRCAVSWTAVPNVTTTYAGEYRIYAGTAPDAQDRYYTVNAPGVTYNYIGGAGTSGGPPWLGNKWSVKNLFEWKSCINCLAKWNYYEHNWGAQQPGDPLLLSVLNDDTRNVSAVIRDSTVEYNWVNGAASFMNISTSSTTATPSGIMEDVTVRHNLGTDLGTVNWGDLALWGNRSTVQMTGGAGDHNIGSIVGYRITIDHNTWIQNGGNAPLYFAYGSGATQDFVQDMTFTNNIQRSMNYQGIVSTLSPSESNSAPGTVGWESSTTGTRTYGSNISQGASPCTPTGTTCPNEATFQAQFVNYGAGNFACASGQTCYNGATVGSTYPHIGADVAAIFVGTDIALSGNNSGGEVEPPVDPPPGTSAGRRRMHIKIR